MWTLSSARGAHPIQDHSSYYRRLPLPVTRQDSQEWGIEHYSCPPLLCLSSLAFVTLQCMRPLSARMTPLQPPAMLPPWRVSTGNFKELLCTVAHQHETAWMESQMGRGLHVAWLMIQILPSFIITLQELLTGSASRLRGDHEPPRTVLPAWPYHHPINLTYFHEQSIHDDIYLPTPNRYELRTPPLVPSRPQHPSFSLLNVFCMR